MRFSPRRLFVLAILGVSCGCVSTSTPPPPEPKPIELRVVHDDGSVTLNSPLPVHLLTHIRATLIDADYDLLYEQLISDYTKRVYHQRDRDPREVMTWFTDNQRDVLILLSRMGQGVNSPDVYWEMRGPITRLQLYGEAKRSSRLTTVDVIRENGQFKLVMIQ
ncbi:MAG: hypothetical protein ACF8PN_00465 [Phycisphaerales bacterium]